MNEKGKKAIRIILLISGLIFLLTGIKAGGVKEVRNKAENICLECIGIG
ncbi:MAG: thioredoxin [Lachnospiraceae bacterium]|nr:thioredoxin [Lachnospiraceae bacterium]